MTDDEKQEKKPKDPLADLTKQVGRLADAVKSQGEMLKCGLSVRLSNGRTFQVYGTKSDLEALQTELAGPALCWECGTNVL